MKQSSVLDWKIFPIALMLWAQGVSAIEQPLIPVESQVLQKKVEVLNSWKQQSDLAAKLPYFSAQTKQIVLDQYMMNAKVFMMEKAISAIFYPLQKLELKQEIFQDNFFAFTRKYCQYDLKKDFDWASLARQFFLLGKSKVSNARWDDLWSNGSFPIEMQQKLYTARITRSLDVIKALCVKEESQWYNLSKYFLQDPIVALYFSQYLTDQSKPKFFCETLNSCRQISHDDFVKKIPRSMMEIDFNQEMTNLWKTVLEDFSFNWNNESISSISRVSTEQARVHLHDELIGVSDFFILTGVLSKDTSNIHDDPLLRSIRPLMNQLVAHKIELHAKKITWEDPLEISIDTTSDFSQGLSMDVKAVKGGFDKMIDKLEKFKISDQMVFDRGFMEWFLRATLNIRYYNEQLYWSNVEAINHHLYRRFESYIKARHKVLPYLSYDKNMANLMTKWFLDNRNEIATLVTKFPEQKNFPLLINHYLGLSALETRVDGE